MYVRVVIARLTQVVMSSPLRRPLASFSISRGIQNEIFGTLTAGTRAQTFNAGVTIKIRPDQSRGGLAKRIMPEVDVKLLIRAARSRRDRVMLETLLKQSAAIQPLPMSIDAGFFWGGRPVTSNSIKRVVLATKLKEYQTNICECREQQWIRKKSKGDRDLPRNC